LQILYFLKLTEFKFSSCSYQKHIACLTLYKNLKLPRASEPLLIDINRSNWTGTAELDVCIHEHISPDRWQCTWYLLQYYTLSL